jgi:hypothetical protein
MRAAQDTRAVKDINRRLRQELVRSHGLKDTAYAVAKYLSKNYDVSEATARGWFTGAAWHAIELVTLTAILKTERLNANFVLLGAGQPEFRDTAQSSATTAEALHAHVRAVVLAHVGQVEEREMLEQLQQTAESFVDRWLPAEPLDLLDAAARRYKRGIADSLKESVRLHGDAIIELMHRLKSDAQTSGRKVGAVTWAVERRLVEQLSRARRRGVL